MPKGLIVVTGMGEPPKRKGMMPPKFGGDRPLPEKKPAPPPPAASEEPQGKEGDPAVIENLAALADHLNLPEVAAKIRECGDEAESAPSAEEEAAENETMPA